MIPGAIPVPGTWEVDGITYPNSAVEVFIGDVPCKRWQVKHIEQLEVLRAFRELGAAMRAGGKWLHVDDMLQLKYQAASEKVIYRAMEREEARGMVEVGMWLRGGWLSPKGEARLTQLEGGAK